MRADVLLVGASSPIGRAIASDLSARGRSVARTSRSGAHDTEALDIADHAQTVLVLKRVRPRAVVYLARPKLGKGDSDANTVAFAVGALRRFAFDCASHGVERMVFASSAAVYGTDSDTPRCEDDEVHADSPYAELKLRSEHALQDISGSTTLSALSLRIFNVYGPGLDSSLVNRLAWGDGATPVVYDTEQFVRDYIHVSDVAQAFGDAVDASDFGRHTLNVGTGIATSNRRLLELARGATRTPAPRDVRSFSVASISSIRELYGFVPKVALESAMRFPARYFRSESKLPAERLRNRR